jgi:hypothetical protein
MRANYVYRVAIIGCALLFLCLFPKPAILDEDDEPSILVTNTDDSGPGSLRQAILDANANPGKDNIEFAIPGIGPHTILPDSSLPIITDRVEIDGYSQVGAERNDNDEWEANNAVLKIVLDGSSITGTSSGLHITAGDSKIRGLVIHSFTTGILIETAGDNKIEENFIGTDVTGITAPGNATNGVEIKGIGVGDNKVDENVISGNVLNGVLIWMGSEENEVSRNFIGTGVTGTETLGNGGSGVKIEGASDNKVGGKSHDDGNLIANNGFHGVAIVGPSASKNRVLSNYIGVDLSGTIAAPNKGDGVAIENASYNLIGGRDEDDDDDDDEEKERKRGNLISGNGANGIRIEGVDARKNVVRSNLIGTDATGEFALGNGSNGVAFVAGTSHNLVGGSWRHARNIISGNSLNGVFLTDIGTDFNRIEGNYIGTDVLGKDAIPNGLDGVAISTGASNNTVGGTRSGSGNLISGNSKRGVSVGMADTRENKIQGNHIGTTALPPFRPEDDDNDDDDRKRRHSKTVAKKRRPLGNGSDGVAIFMDAADNLVGGGEKGATNVIAYNGNVGVLIYNSSVTVGNRVSQNSIFDNDDIGIDLSLATVSPFSDGVTDNDAGDTDAGPNNLQNFPVLDSAIFGGGVLKVTGTIDTPDPEKITVEFFANAAADPSKHGEGKEFLGSVKPNTRGEFEASLPEPGVGEFISATATDRDGNTSEFSATIEMERVPCDLAVDTTFHDFGEVSTLSFADNVFTLSNSAEAGENCVGNISIAGDPKFSIRCLKDDSNDYRHTRHRNGDDCTTFDIAPGKTHKFVVRFDCREEEPEDPDATITISSNDPDGDIIVEVTGTCVDPPDIAADPTRLEFGVTTVDSVAKLSSKIKNVGQMDLVITRAYLSGDNEDQFSLLSFDVPDTLGAGEEEEITVCFAPDSAGDKIAQVNIESNDPDENPFIIELAGTGLIGPGITVTPTSGLITTEEGGKATFEIAAKTAPSADVRIALTSSDTTEGVVPDSVVLPAGSIDPITVTVTGLDDIEIDGDIAYTVVTGDPASADTVYDAFGAADVADVAVTNKNDDGLPCDLAVDTLEYDFGEVTGDTLADKRFVLSNSVVSNFNCVGTIAIEGDPKFSIVCVDSAGADSSHDCTSFDIAPGDTHAFVVRFDCRDQEPMQSSTTITVSSNDPDSVITISVTGECIPVPIPPELVFDDAADTYLDGRHQDFNNGANDLLRIGNKGRAHRRPNRILTRFEFLTALQDAGVTTASQVTSATLEMHVYGSFGEDDEELAIDVIRMNRDWTEGVSDYAVARVGEATYRSAKHGVEGWVRKGAGDVPRDRHVDPDDTQIIETVGKVAWDVTSSVRQMFETGTNFGWLVQSQDESKNRYFRLYSSEYPDPELRPRLIIAMNGDTAPATILAKQQDGKSKFQFEGEALTPEDFSLQQNYPNPFNPETQIRYEIASPATVTLAVFDITGAEVQRLLDRATTPTGTFSVVWDGRDASGRASSSGVYFYRIFVQPQDRETAPFVQTRRMILLK